jgi:competence protein ComEC
MKSAYELAMERLSKASPSIKLTDEQKRQLAELDSQCKAKIAQRELFLKEEIVKAVNTGDDEAVEQLQKQLVSERKSITAQFEEKKDKLRQQK